MIRETNVDPAAASLTEAIRTASLADLAWGPMDAKEAAGFLKVSEKQFNRLAPSVPRHKKTGMGFRYLRSELLSWLRSDDQATGAEGEVEGDQLPRGRQRDGNAESQGVARGSKKRIIGPSVRLV